MMNKTRIHNKKETVQFRRSLRKRLTPAEAFLWKVLKAKQLAGRRFVKQHGIGKYVVDFYCPFEKLIIELDGEGHQSATAQEYDEKRTTYLNGLGYSVLRFENRMVFDNLTSVLMEIKDCFKKET